MEKDIIEQIIDIEWQMFQKTVNIGGRASCQDDHETFWIMRRSQYENWSEDMIGCYFDYLRSCETEGRNLVTEKYGRMMQYTDLSYYNKHVASYMPPVPQSNYQLINRIMPTLIDWEEQFAAAYPRLAGQGRPITSDGDATGFTSMETYARGEFETYPRELLQLYADYVEELKAEGKSLSLMIQDTMVKLYGYTSIEDAEASLR